MLRVLVVYTRTMPYKDIEKNRAAKREYIRKQKMLVHRAKEVPCKDCGIEYPFWIMQFDHVRGEKKFNLSTVGRSKSRAQTMIQLEIEKCDIVCANCHSNRTYMRKQYGEGIYEESRNSE